MICSACKKEKGLRVWVYEDRERTKLCEDCIAEWGEMLRKEYGFK